MTDAHPNQGPTSGLTPHLTIPSRGASAAIDFYVIAFGAEVLDRRLADDGERLIHAHLKINGASLMLNDEFPEYTGIQDVLLLRPHLVDRRTEEGLRGGQTSFSEDPNARLFLAATFSVFVMRESIRVRGRMIWPRLVNQEASFQAATRKTARPTAAMKNSKAVGSLMAATTDGLAQPRLQER